MAKYTISVKENDTTLIYDVDKLTDALKYLYNNLEAEDVKIHRATKKKNTTRKSVFGKTKTLITAFF